MKLFTIATTKVVCHGHGDYRPDTTINQLNDDRFPPLFPSKKLAKDYLDKMEYKSGKSVVEMDYPDGN